MLLVQSFWRHWQYGLQSFGYRPLPSLSCVFVEEAYVSAQGRRRSFEVQDTDAIQALGGSTALTPDFFTQQTVVNFN